MIHDVLRAHIITCHGNSVYKHLSKNKRYNVINIVEASFMFLLCYHIIKPNVSDLLNFPIHYFYD